MKGYWLRVTGYINSASIVGYYDISTDVDDPIQEYNGTSLYRQTSVRVGVAGVHSQMSNEGRTFGGYFNTLFTGSQYRRFEEVTVRPTPHQANVHTSVYLCTAKTGVMQIRLPKLGTLTSTTNTWNRDLSVMFEIDVILVYDNADVEVISSNGSVIINKSGNLVDRYTQNARGTLKLAWTGNNWIITN